jgi:hypothetical protein
MAPANDIPATSRRVPYKAMSTLARSMPKKKFVTNPASAAAR